jgi:hypothetical protein
MAQLDYRRPELDERVMTRTGVAVALLLISIAMTASHGLSADAAPRQVSLTAPAATERIGQRLRPGLKVEYIHRFVRHIDEIVADSNVGNDDILRTLDWSAEDGEVMTSGRADGVAARITGFIKFPEAGDYVLAIQSNDGARLTIGDTLIIDDPDVHPDRFSPNVTVRIAKSGWYPLRLLYFERKGTSTLELYWQPPGAGGFDFVPADAFAHISDG